MSNLSGWFECSKPRCAAMPVMWMPIWFRIEMIRSWVSSSLSSSESAATLALGTAFRLGLYFPRFALLLCGQVE
jgi:hypothetical protein